MKIQGLEFVEEVTIPAEKNYRLINQGIDPSKVKNGGFTYKKWKAPDGTEGSFTFFEGEILKKGKLHGLVVGF